MDGIYFLKKSDDLYYIDESNVGYDLDLLATNYPNNKFVVLNDDKHNGHNNVHTRSEILKACGVDNKLQLACPKCKTKNKYNRSLCRSCDTPMPYYGIITKALGEDYIRALADFMVRSDFVAQSNKRFSKAFQSYETNRANDPFLRLLCDAFFSQP